MNKMSTKDDVVGSIEKQNIQNEMKTLEMVRKHYGPTEDKRIIKNLVALALPFVLLFSSFFSLGSIQSSLHRKDGLGAYSLATIYISGCISSLFFLSIILSKVSCKFALVGSVVSYLIFIAAQFWPMFATLIPAAVILGIGGGLLWTSQANYVSKISEEYAYLTGEDVGPILAKFFGIFFLICQTSIIWGNVILMIVFSTAGNSATFQNKTIYAESVCGAHYCPASVIASDRSNISTELISNLPAKSTLHLLFGIQSGFTVIAIIIMTLFIDPLSRYGEGCFENKTRPGRKELILSTLNQIRNPYQLLLIPFTFFSTFQTGFFAIDFTAGFITCALGMEHIGQVLICYGICAATSALVFGRLIKYTGRLTVFGVIVAVHILVDVMMLKWMPLASQPIGFYLIAGISGIVEGVMSPQITAFTALVFAENKEAAFNNNRLWQGLGYIAAYINATKFCMEFKLYLILAIALIGFICYAIVEILYTRSRKVVDEVVTVVKH